ncbi:PREDICTED: uncharacterized protein LOC106102408 [Papilio polytes]|uniref:uncharacterized protein LOC106102408 n=1 Tax=Papilio polytes TaxID=76194 RepID=UPI00067626AB|nr:PREDICTED: uncharacterized protein LOC106102408 [Papilio polytes]
MKIVILFLTFCRVSAVINQLNDAEYATMPPVFHLDRYKLCVDQTGGIYCMVEIHLVGDSDNDLLRMIHEYSERKETHFNHSRLHYGICFTKMCKDYIKTEEADSKDLLLVIEQCLNASFWDQYKLKTKIDEDTICHSKDQSYSTEPIDVVVAVLCLCILLLNAAGSIYDTIIVKRNHSGNKWLLCFSIKRNWSKLIETQEDRQNGIERLKGLNGMKYVQSQSSFRSILF